MDETRFDEWRASNAANMTLLICAVRALMASHPEPDLLREAWAREMALLWPNHSMSMAGAENPYQDQMRRLQAAFESLIPAP